MSDGFIGRVSGNTMVEFPVTNVRERSEASLPVDLSEDGALPTDYVWVHYVTPPNPLPKQRVSMGDPTFTGSRWEVTWVTESFSADEEAAYRVRLQQSLIAEVQGRLDAFARTRNYHNLLSACTYATDTTNAKFRAEGQYCVDLRSQVWTKLYQVLAEVEAGTRAEPTSIADIENELPAFAWPE